jgi:hypothetical protein
MWMPILLICSSVYAESCWVVTRNEDFLKTQEECNRVSVAKAKMAFESSTIYHVKPMCQKIKIGEGV